MNSLINQTHLLNSMNQALNKLAKSISDQDARLKSFETQLKSFETKVNYIDSVVDRAMNSTPQTTPIAQQNAPHPQVIQQTISDDKIKSIVNEEFKIGRAHV